MKVLVEKALANEEALWPERFPAEMLRERKDVMGTVIFNLQYQNDARMALGSIFKEEFLRTWGELPSGLSIYQGVDLAISTKSRSDYFAIVTVGIDEKGFMYVIDVFRARLSFERQAQAIIAKAGEYDPVRIAVEAIGYQAALAQVLATRTAIPVKAVFPHRDKVTRALRLSALFENRKVLLGPGQDVLAEELLAFPDGEHDDLFDALEMAASLARAGHATKFLRIPGL